jgi:hypothetical protein
MISTKFSLEDALKIRYEEGFEEGLRRVAIAKKLIKKGRSSEEIARISKLPIETIQCIREQNRLQIARRMIKEGDSPEKIARITKLPIETIRSIE